MAMWRASISESTKAKIEKWEMWIETREKDLATNANWGCITENIFFIRLVRLDALRQRQRYWWRWRMKIYFIIKQYNIDLTMDLSYIFCSLISFDLNISCFCYCCCCRCQCKITSFVNRLRVGTQLYSIWITTSCVLISILLYDGIKPLYLNLHCEI